MTFSEHKEMNIDFQKTHRYFLNPKSTPQHSLMIFDSYHLNLFKVLTTRNGNFKGREILKLKLLARLISEVFRFAFRGEVLASSVRDCVLLFRFKITN